MDASSKSGGSEIRFWISTATPPLSPGGPSAQSTAKHKRSSLLSLECTFRKGSLLQDHAVAELPEAASAAFRNGQPYSTQREASSSDANSRCRSVPMCGLAHVSGSTFVHFCRVLRRTLRRSWETSAVRFGNAAHRADPHGTCHLLLPLTLTAEATCIGKEL
ncbi:hypothetical protein L1887_59809 [Cichorium endivia]|nr:hypothetical protein L1887_59809 [Cichorium endivia]